MSIEIMTLSQAADQFNWLLALGLLVFYAFVELLDSGLTFSLTQHKAGKSAAMTFALYLILGLEVLVIVANYLYALPIATGAAIGSYFVVKHEKKHRPLE